MEMIISNWLIHSAKKNLKIDTKISMNDINGTYDRQHVGMIDLRAETASHIELLVYNLALHPVTPLFPSCRGDEMLMNDGNSIIHCCPDRMINEKWNRLELGAACLTYKVSSSPLFLHWEMNNHG